MDGRNKKSRLLLLGLIMAATGLVPPATASAQTVIKVAMVTPEGSPWTNSLHRLAEDVARRSGGAMTFQIYAGGISGDETDVLRKMQADRIHAAGFSGVGLGFLVPEIRILEAPLLYRSYAEVDRVKNELASELAERFKEKGYILLGFAEAGFVHFFSMEKMTGPQGFKPLKMWVWKGDPVAKNSLEAFGIKTVPLNLTDVNTGLETGMINAFYAPPLAALQFQWYASVRYMLDYPMVNSTGAFIIRKNIFDTLSEENQRLLREASGRFCDELVQIARKGNAEALEVLSSAGIEFETPTADQIRLFETKAHRIYEANIGSLYSRALFERVQNLLNGYRRANSN